jgi:GT2 family glycosyltransferase
MAAYPKGVGLVFERTSIIIPVAPQETRLDVLLSDLEALKGESEIIVSSEGSRAKSLNVGAAKASKDFLWFLHADSRVSEGNLNALDRSLQQQPDGLHYFDLAFNTPGLPALSAWGANARSRLFGTPFGDQGFCISRAQFEEVGGYPENVPYGEDLMFVWRVRQAGIGLIHIPSNLITSAREYETQGWLKLFFLYQWRWIAISVPEYIKLLKARN